MPPRRFKQQRSRTPATQSTNFLRRRRERTTLIAGAAFVVLISGIFILSRLTMLDALTLTAVRIEGIDTETAATLEANAHAALAGNYLGLFSRSNVFLYPRNAVASAIQASSTEVHDLDIRVVDRHTLLVSVIERAPDSVVCPSLPDFHGEELSLAETEGCYFADPKGIVFKEAPSFFGAGYKRYYIPTLEGLGEPALPEAEFKALDNIYNETRTAGIHIDAMFVKGEGEYELYARNPVIIPPTSKISGATTTDMMATVPVVIYFNEAAGFTKQTANLISFWTHMTETARNKREPLIFESIDVRYGSNVFYRLSS